MREIVMEGVFKSRLETGPTGVQRSTAQTIGGHNSFIWYNALCDIMYDMI